MCSVGTGVWGVTIGNGTFGGVFDCKLDNCRCSRKGGIVRD